MSEFEDKEPTKTSSDRKPTRLTRRRLIQGSSIGLAGVAGRAIADLGWNNVRISA